MGKDLVKKKVLFLNNTSKIKENKKVQKQKLITFK